ncbi:MAG: aminopeptidase N, partial [Actinobacteria bacterium]|nr:aminopeptidase N [Actinomycetota bacterium]
LYSQGETADIRRMFPCFDQPSLKATFSLTVTTPGHWEAISNHPVEATEIVGEKKIWKFKTTPRIPTYLAALIAGPYSHVHDVYKGQKEVPLGFYCRKSMAQYLDSKALNTLKKHLVLPIHLISMIKSLSLISMPVQWKTQAQLLFVKI